MRIGEEEERFVVIPNFEPVPVREVEPVEPERVEEPKKVPVKGD